MHYRLGGTDVKKGFVLMETIVVISVLCVILIMLYASYSKILIGVNKKTLYDNTEYLYKTSLVRDYLEKTVEEDKYQSSQIYMYCRNSVASAKCYDGNITDDFKNDLFSALGVESIYISIWNTTEIAASDITFLEATTQNYIKTIDPEVITSEDDYGYRIIVMFKDENDKTGKDVYQYASLRFKDRM